MSKYLPFVNTVIATFSSLRPQINKLDSGDAFKDAQNQKLLEDFFYVVLFPH